MPGVESGTALAVSGAAIYTIVSAIKRIFPRVKGDLTLLVACVIGVIIGILGRGEQSYIAAVVNGIVAASAAVGIDNVADRKK